MVDTLTVSTSTALTLASGGIQFASTFDQIHEAITHVLGWDVFTHELAESGPWEEAARLVLAQLPLLEPMASLAREASDSGAGLDFDVILKSAVEDVGDTVSLSKGTGKRAEHPIASMKRIAPDKPIIVLETN